MQVQAPNVLTPPAAAVPQQSAPQTRVRPRQRAPQAAAVPKQSACSSVKRFGLGAIVACLFSPVNYGIVKLFQGAGLDGQAFQAPSHISPHDAKIIKNSICPITEMVRVTNRDNTEDLAKSMGLVESGVNGSCYAFPPEVEIPYISVTQVKIEQFVHVAIWVPLQEEMTYRYGINTMMEFILARKNVDRRTSKIVRVVYNVAAFTLAHAPNAWAFSNAMVINQLIIAFIAGSGLMMMVEDRRFGLPACIGAHMANNAISVVPNLLLKC